MREIDVFQITDAVRQLCIDANMQLSSSLEQKLCRSCAEESSVIGKKVLSDLTENLKAAQELQVPICQDTGMAIIFLEIGQDVHFTNGNLNDAVNEGVRRGYSEGLLRCSIVADPLRRVNTNDNTPAVIHTAITEGKQVKITVSPKGFGSENMSQIKMFTPSATAEAIEDYVVSVTKDAGSNPCPPIIIGVGIGGDFEWSACLAKKALCRDIALRNEDPFYAEMESNILDKINQTGIGPQGFGGDTTALAVNIEKYATHIAGLPVAVNIGCHVTRHKSIIL